MEDGITLHAGRATGGRVTVVLFFINLKITMNDIAFKNTIVSEFNDDFAIYVDKPVSSKGYSNSF